MPQDVHGYAVGWALEQLGVPTRYFYASDLPERADIRFEFGSTLESVKFQCADSWKNPSNIWCDVTNFRSVWFRRSKPPTLRGDLGAGDRRIALDDWRSVIHSLEFILSENVPLCVNHPTSRSYRNLKAYHLCLARKHGLRIPDTLITNVPDEICDFVDVRNRDDDLCIAKSMHLPWWSDTEGRPYVFTTSLISSDDVKDADARSDPIIIQPLISKKHEVRITKIGPDLIAVEIDSQATTDGKIDFRRHVDWKDFGHALIDIPSKIADQVLSLSNSIGLLFATFDFIVEPSGEWVFLEFNHMGNWLWIEYCNPEVRLLDRMARYLASGNKDYRYDYPSDYINSRHFVDEYEANHKNIYLEETRNHPNVFQGIAPDE